MSGEGQKVSKIIRFKKDTPIEVIDKTEQDIIKLGGVINQKTTLTVKSLSYTIPADVVTAFASNEHVAGVEDDAEVRIQ